MSTDNSYQTYLKDCDCENGGIILHEGEAVCRWCRKPYGKGGKMYYEPNHFKASKQPKQERIEVMISGDGTAGQYTFILPFKREHFIHPDKFPAIKQAIESVLNNDTVVEDEYTVKVTKQHWEELHALLDGYEKGMDKIVQDKVYACMESIWNEARATNPMAGMKYDTFQDFKNIWVEPTNDNAFVWDDQLVGEFACDLRNNREKYEKEYKSWRDSMGEFKERVQQSKQSEPTPQPPLFKEQGWEIMKFTFRHRNGEVIEISSEPATKYYRDVIEEYPDAVIKSVLRKSDNVIFSVGDSVCLNWYPPFDVVQPIKRIEIENGNIYLYYDKTAKYELQFARINPKHKNQ